MRGTEYRVDVFAIGGGAEAQKTRLHHVEPLPALLEEDFGDFRHFRIKCHARFLRHMDFSIRYGCLDQKTRTTASRAKSSASMPSQACTT